MSQFFHSSFRKAVVFIYFLTVAFSLFTVIPTQAASISGQASNFTKCGIENLIITQPTSDEQRKKDIDKFFGDCLTSILNFIVIIALIALVLRIVILSISNVAPGSNGDGIASARVAIQDTIIGILFLGGAALFLSPLNPLFNNVNIFNLPSIDSAGKNSPSSIIINSTPVQPIQNSGLTPEQQDNCNIARNSGVILPSYCPR